MAGRPRPKSVSSERLLRETGIPTGLLCTPEAVRLVYAPAGETSGHITFRIADMAQVMGRPILAALQPASRRTSDVPRRAARAPRQPACGEPRGAEPGLHPAGASGARRLARAVARFRCDRCAANRRRVADFPACRERPAAALRRARDRPDAARFRALCRGARPDAGGRALRRELRAARPVQEIARQCGGMATI